MAVGAVGSATRFVGRVGRPLAGRRAQAVAVRPCRRPRCAALPDVKTIIETLADGENLSKADARGALEAVMDNGDPAQIAAFLVLLRAKGETPEEVAGLAEALQSQAVRVETPYDVLDIVGTGGDNIGSINISTGSCVVAAAAGAKVAKHGNRSVSSQCGSADVLEAMGVAIDLPPKGVAECIDKAGVGFMFAPIYHPAMKVVVPVRKSLRIRTVFNILGPMLNPARASYGLVGVFTPKLMSLMAEALQRLGTKKSLVVHSMGLDELTPMGPADVVEVTPLGTRSYTLQPSDVGIPPCEVQDLKGGNKQQNAQMLQDVFGGAPGPKADALCLNAGYALAACGVAADPKEGVAMSREALRQGRAANVLQKWVEVSQEQRAAHSEILQTTINTATADAIRASDRYPIPSEDCTSILEIRWDPQKYPKDDTDTNNYQTSTAWQPDRDLGARASAQASAPDPRRPLWRLFAPVAGILGSTSIQAEGNMMSHEEDPLAVLASPVSFQRFLDVMKNDAARDLVRKINRFLHEFSEARQDPHRDSAALQRFLSKMEPDFRKNRLWRNQPHEELNTAMEAGGDG
ncbi:unnamed protein product [Ostreobium quekettii]|uniref:anthranilate phosphoribosyltransferase n=1 Tax=Ostreobium quekettii TaxID=121088 RepID=A0A8S1J521_9CHLO|nr:unnamed protein product [Ostreobium quekettii]